MYIHTLSSYLKFHPYGNLQSKDITYNEKVTVQICIYIAIHKKTKSNLKINLKSLSRTGQLHGHKRSTK